MGGVYRGKYEKACSERLIMIYWDYKKVFGGFLPL